MISNIPSVSGLSIDSIGRSANSSSGFSNFLSEAVSKVDKQIKSSSELKERHALGDPNVSLPQVMLASQESQIALTMTVEVRNKVLEAYRDIINMPV